ncbi:MAG: hypothetical protein Q8J64_06515 [Thermodesulfovibrionales bacterium]|nr:hypothetical protein [Thermodesulfovibrionales bacterium]
MERLRPFGVIEHPNPTRGKGSEKILILKSGLDKNGKYHGPQYPVKHHGEGTEIYKPVITNILKRFNITPAEFWSPHGFA